VMSTNQYAAFYRINPATAQKAFQSLVEDGVLYKQRGIGMFVSPGAREMLRSQHRERFFNEVLLPMLKEAHAIGITDEELIGIVQEATSVDISDCQAEGTYLPWLEQVVEPEAQQAVPGTPAVLIDGEQFSGDLTSSGSVRKAVEAA